jgi:hypothetical protein
MTPASQEVNFGGGKGLADGPSPPTPIPIGVKRKVYTFVLNGSEHVNKLQSRSGMLFAL